MLMVSRKGLDPQMLNHILISLQIEYLSIVPKLGTVHGKFREFCEDIAYFRLLQVGRNRIANTNFTKLRTEIADPIYP